MKTHWVFSMYKDHMYPREFVNVAEAASLDNNRIVWHNRDIIISFIFSLYVCRTVAYWIPWLHHTEICRKLFFSFSDSGNKCVIAWKFTSTWCEVCVGATSFQEYFYLNIECFYLFRFFFSITSHPRWSKVYKVLT